MHVLIVQKIGSQNKSRVKFFVDDVTKMRGEKIMFNLVTSSTLRRRKGDRRKEQSRR